MKVENHIPSDLLKPYVKSYTIIETSAGMETTVLPHCGLIIALQFKGQVSYDKQGVTEKIPSLALSGMRKSFRKFKYEKDTGTILIIFKETGAASFFKEPLFEIFEDLVGLDNFFRQAEINMLEDQVSSARDNMERIRVIDTFLLTKVVRNKPDELISSAISQIYHCRGTHNIRSLSHNFSISQDAFEKRFRKRTGASPKQFSSIIRMKSVVAGGQQSRSLTDLAYHFDFYDQSHLIKEFRLFTGQSPKEFFKSPYPW